ncbi:MAG: ABC transporter substrate-binding protein [Solobacterium sp.]|nr:ABC transporter substrate-binding protein [Solobacterium sp.]
MKQLMNVLLASSLLLVGCGGQKPAEETVDAQDAKELFGCNIINVYNAGEYIGEDVLGNFEEMYTAKVNYETFESNETMYTKLLGGNAYDVLVPSDYMIERLISEDMLQPIDKAAITNLSQVNPDVLEMQKVFDPNLEYAVPYFWGTVGLVYNKNNVDPAVIEEKGWDILLDSNYKGQVFMYDSQRDAFMVAFKALGYSMNTDNEAEIHAAYNWLVNVDKAVEPSYVTDEVIDAMLNGEKDIAIMYSGDASYVLSENEDMAWIEPNQGTNVWVDAMVIPANATCPGLANAFINYITDYDASYANSDEIGYTSVNKKVFEELSGAGGTYEGINAYIPRTGYEKDEVFHYNEILRQELGHRWNQVKIGG